MLKNLEAVREMFKKSMEEYDPTEEFGIDKADYEKLIGSVDEFIDERIILEKDLKHLLTKYVSRCIFISSYEHMRICSAKCITRRLDMVSKDHHNEAEEHEHGCCGHHHENEHDECSCHLEHNEHESCGCHHEHEEHEGCGCHHEHDHHHGHEHNHVECHSHACSCGGHEHHHEHEMSPKAKMTQILVAAGLLIAAYLAEHFLPNLTMVQMLLIFLVPYLVAGFDVLRESVENIVHGEIFGEAFLMSIATIGALLIAFVPGGEPQFAEAVFVMLFFQIGEWFEGIAEGNSEKAISQLMDIRPDSANVERDGVVLTVAPEEVRIGEIVVVRPGEKVPMDGTVIEGTSALNTVALTGESVPRDVKTGDAILSGCVNTSGVLRVKVEKAFGESTAAKILDLVKNAGSKKSKSENFITRFARIYTPIVVCAAVILAVVPPLVSGDFMANFAMWLLRALTFLIVSCPCALVISVPLTFFGGIGAASKNGILIKGSSYMDALSKTDTVVFDKTGTLTKGVFEVTTLHPEMMDEHELLHMAAHVERFSTHPIAESLRAAFGDEDDGCNVSEAEEIVGHGIRAKVNGKTVCVGNTKMMDAVGAKWKSCDEGGTIIHVSVDGTYIGHIHISDVVKNDAEDAIKKLKAEAVRQTVMLTGDRQSVAEKVAAELKLDAYHAELLPADKVDHVEKLMHNKPDGKSLVFVGDGINDAPVLARANVGIAMGALGSDAAIEAADVVLMDDQPSKIAKAIGISRRTISIAKQNITIALAIKIGILVLAASGLAPMWLAVFGDTGVMLICVLNATRALKFSK